jgi:hypothetical protein
MTHSIHKEGDVLQIYLRAIFRKTRHYAQAHITSGALCPLATRRTQTAVQSGSLASVCYSDFCGGLLLLLLLLFLLFLLLKIVFYIANLHT